MIRQLPSHIINQIAAGEVVERPASVVKELVENSLDAGATKIQVNLFQAGQTRIQIIDDGCGMSREDLSLAVQRHATSKLPEDDLFHIHTMGFRGEALSSVGAISRLSITTRQQDQEQGWQIQVEGGAASEPAPAAWEIGTKIQVDDLFYAIPARLKFLKSLQTELNHCQEVLQKILIGHPEVAFKVMHEEKILYDRGPESYLDRIAAVFGNDFRDHSFAIKETSEDDQMTLTGFMGVPTYNRNSQKLQYLFVNGRPIRDRGIQAAIKQTYGDLLFKDRYPIFVLYLTLPPEAVDVNVHPAKAEVRFRDFPKVRSFITRSCREGLVNSGNRSGVVVDLLSHAAKTSQGNVPKGKTPLPLSGGSKVSAITLTKQFSQGQELSPQLGTRMPEPVRHQTLPARMPLPSNTSEAEEEYVGEEKPDSVPVELGEVIGQIFNTYILCQSEKGLVVIDQHAAHERLIYEKMKISYKETEGVRRQMLLLPETVTLSPHNSSLFQNALETLSRLGLVLEIESPSTVVVKEVPVIMGDFDIQKLVHDLADELSQFGVGESLEKKLDYLLATFSCHGSIRAGRKLQPAEMQAMVQQIQEGLFTGQCNHGRPTHILLRKQDLENFFERS